MDTPQISRSGRVLKKSAKVKEMEDFIKEVDAHRISKNSKTVKFHDKRVTPLKIHKISLNVQKGGQKRMSDMPSSSGKQLYRPTFQEALKSKQDIRRTIYNDSSDGSKESGMDTPQILRSGRVLKKSAEVKEMEDFDINELDVHGKSKKAKMMEEFDDKRVAPIKIPKMSLNVQKGGQKRMSDMPSSSGKQLYRPTFQEALKSKQDIRCTIYNDSSDGSKESVSSPSESSSSSPTPPDASDDDDPYNAEYQNNRKNLNLGMQALQVQQDKVIVEQNQPRSTKSTLYAASENVSTDVLTKDYSEKSVSISDEEKDAEFAYQFIIKVKERFKDEPDSYKKFHQLLESVRTGCLSSLADLQTFVFKEMSAIFGNNIDLIEQFKSFVPYATIPEPYEVWRRKATGLATTTSDNVNSTGPSNVAGLSIAAQNKAVSQTAASIADELIKGLTESTGVLSTEQINEAVHLRVSGDFLTFIGQIFIECEVWRKKAKGLAMKTSANVITTGPSNVAGLSNAAQNKAVSQTAASISDELLKGLIVESKGVLLTVPIEAAAHVKSLGDFLAVIGQRLIEHEVQTRTAMKTANVITTGPSSVAGLSNSAQNKANSGAATSIYDEYTAQLINVAADLKLLGDLKLPDEFFAMSSQILTVQEEHDTTCLLFDTLLCIKHSLLRLTSEIPIQEYSVNNVLNKTVDLINYFLPYFMSDEEFRIYITSF